MRTYHYSTKAKNCNANCIAETLDLFWTKLVLICEYFAKKYDYPVFFYKVKKVKRGYYEFEIEEVATQPQEIEYGFIVEKSANILENLIKEAPQYWLWSHRRWKLKYEQA